MNFLNHPKIIRGSGRPRHSPVHSLKFQLWFYWIAAELKVTSAYAVEKYYFYNEPNADPNKKFVCKNQFRNYKNGNNGAKSEIIDWFGEKFPDTKKSLEHPFWLVIQTPMVDIEELYIQLGHLRPEISDLLFYPNKTEGKMPIRRKKDLFKTIDKVSEGSDWDALTACIGLIQEIQYYNFGPGYFTGLYLKCALKILLPFISQDPYVKIADDLFNYLYESFFSKCQDPHWVRILNSTDIKKSIRKYRFMSSVIQALGIFRHHSHIHPTCLYLAERYLKPSVLYTIAKYHQSGDWKKVTQLSEVKLMTRCLRRWEKRIMENKSTTTM